MPDLPQPGGAPPAPGGGAPPQGGAPGGGPPGGAPPGQGGGGGGIAQAIVQTDATLYKISQAVAQNQQLGPDVKSAAQEALSSFRKFSQLLVKAAGGDGGGAEPDADDQGGGGTTTPEQGGNAGAVPMTHQAMRGR